MNRSVGIRHRLVALITQVEDAESIVADCSAGREGIAAEQAHARVVGSAMAYTRQHTRHALPIHHAGHSGNAAHRSVLFSLTTQLQPKASHGTEHPGLSPSHIRRAVHPPAVTLKIERTFC